MPVTLHLNLCIFNQNDGFRAVYTKRYFKNIVFAIPHFSSPPELNFLVLVSKSITLRYCFDFNGELI